MALNVVDNFGTGTLWAVRKDASNMTPVKFGVLQEVDIDFSFTNKELMGQYQFPVDVARGACKITGKAKQAQIYSEFFDLLFGQGVTAGAGLGVALNENHAIPTSSPYTVTATQHSVFTQDLGVNYNSTGVPFMVGASAATGVYSGPASGVYTFASGDEGASVNLSYEYTLATGVNELVLANELMGSGPYFVIVLSSPYKGNVLNIHLNQCTSSKLTLPMKNQDFTIEEFDFEAYADAGNNIATITVTQ